MYLIVLSILFFDLKIFFGNEILNCDIKVNFSDFLSIGIPEFDGYDLTLIDGGPIEYL
jgi:hypothetical protein